MKKLIALLLAAAVALLAGCGAVAKDTVMDAPMENGVAREGIYDSALPGKDLYEGDYESSTDKTTAVTDRKLIRTISLNTETEDMDLLLAAIDSKVAALGGYMENREVYTGSRYPDYSPSRRANLTVRIPKDRLDEFVAHVGNESNITSSTESSDDVTLTYVAVQSRMTALEKEEARLLQLIDKAANLTELLELEKRLTEVRTELENVTSQLLLYDNLVDYGTVNITVYEVKEFTPMEEPGFGSRISTGFTQSLRNLWTFLKELVIFLIVASPYLIPIGAVVVVIVLFTRRSLRRKRKNTPRSQNTAEE